jgi:Predicted membrane protein
MKNVLKKLLMLGLLVFGGLTFIFPNLAYAETNTNVYNTTPSYNFQETQQDKEKAEQKSKEDKAKQQQALDDEKAKNISKKEIVLEGGQPLKSKEYPLENYVGISTIAAAEPYKQGIVGMSNGIFSLTKIIWSGIDTSIDTISSKQIIEEQIPKVQTVANNLWNSLSNTYAIMLIALAFLIGFFSLAIKSNAQEAFMTMFKTVLVFLIAGVWFAKTSVFINAFNSVSDNVQTSILSAGTTLRTTPKPIPQGQETQATTAVLRNTLFNVAVYEPYLLMNWGTIDENKINKTYGDIDKVTELNKNSDTKDQLNKIRDDQVNKKHNKYMDHEASGVYSKIAFSIMSLIVVLAVGIPLLIISISNLLIQFLILAVVVLLPLAFLISLIPKYSNGAYQLLEKLIFLFISKSFISLFVLLTLLIVSITNNVIPPENVGSYVLNCLLLSVTFSMLITKRKELISTITGGAVQLSDGGSEKGVRGKVGTTLIAVSALSRLGRTGKKTVRNAKNSTNNTHSKSSNSSNRSSKREQGGRDNKTNSPNSNPSNPTSKHQQNNRENKSQSSNNNSSNRSNKREQNNRENRPKNSNNNLSNRSNKREQGGKESRPKSSNNNPSNRSNKRELGK